MTDQPAPATAPQTPAPTLAEATVALATKYDGFTVLVVDLATAIPDVATVLNNLKLKQGDVLICFVGRANG